MATVKVVLTEIIDYSFPIFAAFEFVDQSGDVIVVHEKLPVVGVEEVGLEAKFPIKTVLECTIGSASKDEVWIDISKPHAIEDIHGRTQFRVSADLVDS